jgi:dihydrofolate reductase
MKIRTRMGISIDGFVATADGWPVLLQMPTFTGRESHGQPEFLEGIAAVAMGRTTFEPAIGRDQWPWPGKQVYVLTSRPLPDEVPDDVIIADGGPEDLLERLRSADLDGDVQLLGGPQTIHSLISLGAVDRLALLLLPILVGKGLPFSPPGSPQLPLTLESQRAFPDGVIELVYSISQGA